MVYTNHKNYVKEKMAEILKKRKFGPEDLCLFMESLSRKQKHRAVIYFISGMDNENKSPQEIFDTLSGK